MLMNRLFYFCIILSFLLIACAKSTSDYRASGAPPVVIRGYEARNDDGADLAYIGYPDINLFYPSGNQSTASIAFTSFPNPASDIMSVIFFSKKVNVLARVWIVPATFDGNGSEATLFFGTTIIPPASPPLLDTTILLSSSHHYLRIQNPSEGYYRIYLKTDGALLWDNIVFSKSLP